VPCDKISMVVDMRKGGFILRNKNEEKGAETRGERLER